MTLLLKSSSSGGPIYCVYQHSNIWLLPMFKYWPRIPMKKSFFDNLQTHASPFLEDLKSSAKYYNVWNLSVSCLSIFSLLRIMTGVIINDENDELLFLVWFFTTVSISDISKFHFKTKWHFSKSQNWFERLTVISFLFLLLHTLIMSQFKVEFLIWLLLHVNSIWSIVCSFLKFGSCALLKYEELWIVCAIISLEVNRVIVKKFLLKSK